jgi:hypothetical protein
MNGTAVLGNIQQPPFIAAMDLPNPNPSRYKNGVFRIIPARVGRR